MVTLSLINQLNASLFHRNTAGYIRLLWDPRNWEIRKARIEVISPSPLCLHQTSPWQFFCNLPQSTAHTGVECYTLLIVKKLIFRLCWGKQRCWWRRNMIWPHAWGDDFGISGFREANPAAPSSSLVSFRHLMKAEPCTEDCCLPSTLVTFKWNKSHRHHPWDVSSVAVQAHFRN